MQEQQNEPFSDIRSGMNLVFIVVRAHAMCLVPFLRYGVGINVPGFDGITAMILMFIVMGASADSGMLGFLGAWVVVVIFQRIRALSFYKRGVYLHSEYWGWPWLGKYLSRAKTEQGAKACEPALCVLLGLMLMPLSVPLGLFVSLGVVSFLIIRGADAVMCQRQLTALRDLQIEQRALSERLRGSRNDF
jgi:hypothetical protein